MPRLTAPAWSRPGIACDGSVQCGRIKLRPSAHRVPIAGDAQLKYSAAPKINSSVLAKPRLRPVPQLTRSKFHRGLLASSLPKIVEGTREDGGLTATHPSKYHRVTILLHQRRDGRDLFEA